jgi:hypothetical protein
MFPRGRELEGAHDRPVLWRGARLRFPFPGVPTTQRLPVTTERRQREKKDGLKGSPFRTDHTSIAPQPTRLFSIPFGSADHQSDVLHNLATRPLTLSIPLPHPRRPMYVDLSAT